ncbi:MAG: hypothetical protein CMC81_00060 [Flavobacteriaceae bacterium]|nr:hypothetical protein [Flavobacteriaceae bacterium]|tara:strand:- start:12605 stop:14227 length:1623 start_codon:yes stop_codon:yes gene_type:complete
MKKYLNFFILIFVSYLNGQLPPEVSADVTSSTFNIGEQIDYILNVELDSIQEVEFPDKLSINPLEILGSLPIDTQKVGKNYLLVKRYNLIQFDSGYYSIPSQRILVNGFSKLTNPVKIKVNGILVDTLKQKMFNIKPLQVVNKSYRYLYLKTAVFLLILLVAILILYVIKQYQKKLLNRKKIIPPFEKAINALKELEKRKPEDQIEYKSYYSDLIDVLRLYFDEETDIDALESTSNQLILKLEELKRDGKLDLEDKTIKNLKTVLSTADLVKFARAIPDINKKNTDIKLVEEVVVKTKELLPEPTQEEIRAKEKYEELLRKQKLNKIVRLSFYFVGISTLFTLSILFLIYGYYPVRDTILRYPTKRLIDCDWVTSEYGVPPIKISSPKVFRRGSIDQKNSIFFQIDSIESDFYAEILFEIKLDSPSNKKPSDNIAISNAEDTQKIIDKTLNRLQKIGGVNILFDTENFKTPNGLPTLRLSGTLDYFKEANKERVRSNFTSLVINYDEGSVTMTFFYEKNDRYGEKILNKMIQSIELIREL